MLLQNNSIELFCKVHVSIQLYDLAASSFRLPRPSSYTSPDFGMRIGHEIDKEKIRVTHKKYYKIYSENSDNEAMEKFVVLFLLNKQAVYC